SRASASARWLRDVTLPSTISTRRRVGLLFVARSAAVNGSGCGRCGIARPRAQEMQCTSRGHAASPLDTDDERLARVRGRTRGPATGGDANTVCHAPTRRAWRGSADPTSTNHRAREETADMPRGTEIAGKVMGKVKGARQALTGGSGVFERLATEHGEISTMIRRVSVSGHDSKVRAELFPRIRRELLAHARAEEREVYSSFRAIPELAEHMTRSAEEHHEIERMLDELNLM